MVRSISFTVHWNVCLKYYSGYLRWWFPFSAPSGNAEGRSPSASTLPGFAGMANSPGMQSLMQQMLDNPQLMQSMMSAPYTQSIFQQMASNPALAEQIVLNNPLFSSKIEIRHTCRLLNTFPTLIFRQSRHARTDEVDASDIPDAA